MELVSSTCTLAGYSSNLQRHVGAQKLSCMKSHDYHVLIQDILLVAIRHSLQSGPLEAVIKLGTMFKRICMKVVKPSKMEDLKTFAVEMLFLLELWFPPGFFDAMTYLVLHLVEELAICSHVHARWCYSMERYTDVLT